MFRFVVILFFFTLSFVEAGETDPEALRECGDLHRIDMHTIANAHAEYSNSKCMLTCYEGNKTLSVNAISEGYVCDLAFQSKCRNGKCNGSEAVHQCSTLHHLDLENFKTLGTEYSADLCSLKCVIEGKVASVNPINEGSFCRSVTNGICRKGSCLSDAQSTNRSSIPTSVPITVPTVVLTTAPTIAANTIQTTIPTTEPTSVKGALIKKAQVLLSKADEVIEKQSANPKVANEVTLLISSKATIKKLISELEPFTDDPSFSKTAFELEKAETKLDYLLKLIANKLG